MFKTKAEVAAIMHGLDDEDGRELVLLLDDSMVGEIGGELGRVLAQDSALQSTRIILMSRNPEEPATAALGFPVTAVVRKPLLRVEVLLQALRLPKGAAAVRVSSSRVPFEVAGASAAEARRGPHVLVVDDDEISRSVSSQLLRRMGCVVELAVSGAKAIELARGMQFELIFMDCQMPEIDGYTTTERIRLAAGKDAPPIVALTANISAEDREKCFAAGMCDFVGKPVRRAELARVLRRWTRVEGAEQDRPARGEAGPGAQA